jgi:hypothetical protein
LHPYHHDAVVDRRRARGTLLGIRAGNQMLHPAWQLDPRRRDTLPGLCLVLTALSVATTRSWWRVDTDPVDG